MYVLVILFPHRKSWLSLSAAAILLVAGVVGPMHAFAELVNWNILMIYVGCLVIADLFIYSGVPAALAEWIVRKSPTLGLAVVAILTLTGVISAFVENVATVLVMAPIAMEISRRVKMDPRPFLIGLAVMANLQGTATLVGDPPSMIFASYASYSFNDFFFSAGRPSIFFAVQAGAVVGALYFYGYFRKLPRIHMEFTEGGRLSFVPTGLLALMILGLAAISFHTAGGLHTSSGLWCVFLAASGMFWFVFVRKEKLGKAWEIMRGLDWDTILFLVGIFVVIGSITEAGLLEDLAAVLSWIIDGDDLLGFVVIVGFSVLVSGFVDNVPYIIAMLPVADMLAKSLGLAPEYFMFGLLIGSCLGGNLTPFGASANIVAVGVLKKDGRKVDFLDWTKICLPFTVLTTAASAMFVHFLWR